MNNYPSKAHLTDAMAAKFPLVPSGQKLIADAKQPGLYLKVGKTSKSWVVQREVKAIDPETLRPKRKTIRKAFGTFPALSVKEARDAAPVALGDALEEKGSAENRRDVTLGEGWRLYRAMLEKTRKSAATVYAYRNAIETEHLLGIWIDRPLSELTTETGMTAVARRHDKITRRETGPGGGAYAANGAMRTLRVIYNWCRKMGYTPALADGSHPTLRVIYNPEEARNDAMSRLDLPGWWEAYLGMQNRVRAEFQLFLLLSGMRSGSLVDARWEDVDVGGRLLHVPAPKGGKAKAYDVPLTRPMLACLARARRAARERAPNFADRIIFPGDQRRALRGSNSFTGHMSKFATKEPKLPCSGHGLRHTYRNACTWAGVEVSLSKKLMNHSQKGDIHSGTYGSREGIAPDLLDAQDRISATIMSLLQQQKEGARRIAA